MDAVQKHVSQQDTDKMREVLWVTSKGDMCSEMLQRWNWWYSQVVCVCCVYQGADEQTRPPNTGLQPDVKQCDWCTAACWLPEAPRLCLWAESKLKQSTEQQEAFSSIVYTQLDYTHTLNGLQQSQALLQPPGNQKIWLCWATLGVKRSENHLGIVRTINNEIAEDIRLSYPFYMWLVKK